MTAGLAEHQLHLPAIDDVDAFRERERLAVCEDSRMRVYVLQSDCGRFFNADGDLVDDPLIATHVTLDEARRFITRGLDARAVHRRDAALCA